MAIILQRKIEIRNKEAWQNYLPFGEAFALGGAEGFAWDPG